MQTMNKQASDFLFMVYFGTDGADNLERFISRAYLDMNRTLHGIAQIDPDHTIHQGAKTILSTHFNELQKVTVPDDLPTLREAFDHWHHTLVLELQKHYRVADISFCMTYGQAQKWINMTMKYCWLFGESDLPFLKPWFPAAHIAVDSIILDVVKIKTTIVPPSVPWSKWDNHQEYQSFQTDLRTFATGFPTVLDLEYKWWNEYRQTTATVHTD